MTKNWTSRLKINRRQAMQGLAATSLATSTSFTASQLLVESKAQGAAKKPKFIIVIGCSGGASILDSVLAMSESEVKAAGGTPSTLNCFPDQLVQKISGSPFRALDLDTKIATLGNQAVKGQQSGFVKKHAQDMMVVQIENTSVNHGVAQHRSINGNDAWSGRTLMDCVAETYGQGMAIPNMNMGSGGFAMPGTDKKLSEYATQIPVTSPLYFPFSLHSNKGLAESVDPELLAKARSLRHINLEQSSNFYQTFRDNTAIKRWLNNRENSLAQYESMNLINKLHFVEGSAQGLTKNPESDKLTQLFPNYRFDRLEAEAILGYLSITSGVSCAVTLGPSFQAVVGQSGLGDIINPPIAFDFSHNDHRAVQAMMWTRVMGVVDKLITLLKAKEFDSETGESYWDRTLIYFATDFGRDKIRASGSESFGTGHHLNNANLVISPMVKGNTFLGGLDYKTGLTCGFDKNSGAVAPGTFMREDIMFSGILQAMDIDTSKIGLPDVPSMRKKI